EVGGALSADQIGHAADPVLEWLVAVMAQLDSGDAHASRVSPRPSPEPAPQGRDTCGTADARGWPTARGGNGTGCGNDEAAGSPRGTGRFRACQALTRTGSLVRGSSLELRTGRELDGVARRDLDLGAGLRVAALASGTLGALHGQPARDRELVAGGHGFGEGLEDAVEHVRDLLLGQTGLLGNLCDEFAAVLSHGCVLLQDVGARECGVQASDWSETTRR